jgi:colicin import membrane protein
MTGTAVMDKPSTDLVVADTLKAEVVFAPGGIDKIIADITAKVRAVKTDISTKAGREEIGSLAYKIARSKTALDNLGKDLVAEWKKKSGEVDAERRSVRERLDALRDEVRKPLTDWEDADKARIADHEAALVELTAFAEFSEAEPATSVIRARIEALAARPARLWQEFAQRAEEATELARWTLSEMLAAAETREAERAELERLRKEAADRERKEREDHIAATAAERARVEAETKAAAEAKAAAERAQADADRAAAEQRRVEQERTEALARAEKAEADRKAAAEKAERDRIAAEAKAEADKKAAAEKAERDRVAAIEAERKRIAEAKAVEDAATAARAADAKHRAEINGAAIDALAGFGLDGLTAARVVDAIADGFIPRVTISY